LFPFEKNVENFAIVGSCIDAHPLIGNAQVIDDTIAWHLSMLWRN
jgi:hypothetical protein